MSAMANRKSGGPLLISAPLRLLSLLPSSWRARAWLAAAVAVAAAIVVGFTIEPVGDSYNLVRKGVLTNFGLGMVAVAVWLLALAGVLAVRRNWLRYANLWAGSLAMVAVVLGVLAFFESTGGGLSWFTLDGDVPLGGKVGDAIIGSATWQGVLSLLAIFLAGASVAAPALAVDVAMALGRLSVHGYVVLVVAAKWTSKMYRFDRSSRSDKGRALQGEPGAEPNMPPEVLTPYTRTRTVQTSAEDAAGKGYSWQPKTPLIENAPTDELPVSDGSMATDYEPDRDDGRQVATFEPMDGPPVTGQETVPQPSPGGKFNRYWDPSAEATAEEASLADTPMDDLSPDDSPEITAVGRQWARPSIDLLQEVPEGAFSEEGMQATAETIKRTLADYGVEVEIGQIKPGPTVTMYGLIPGWVRRYKQVKETDEQGRPRLDEHGKQVVTREETKTRVKVDTILAREKDLSLALKTPTIRIETPVMGKAQIGIEVPNPNASIVALRSVMESQEFAQIRSKAALPVALGKGSGGETVVIDLAKMPHLLIAGATGSGKSVCINALVSCLITEKTPEEMRLLLIDPKRVEMTPYNGIPHLLTPVVVEIDQVVGLLKGLIQEMLARYRRLEEVGVKNIATYDERMPEKMPYLVVAIDELADLMMTAAFDVEQSICRLAQLGRAVGIHLIVATQRPSVDVVTGLIKANFPSRISFGVTSQVDSRTILDAAGADKLLGRGDMLYLPLDASRPMRAQGVFISDQEIERLVKFWQITPRAHVPKIHLRAVQEDQDDNGEEEQEKGYQDEFLGKAIELANSYSKISTSLLQRRLRIGYPRAARLMDQLEERHIVGPSDGSKSRDVIISNS